ncbi:hypothetical protein STIAU_3886 [Stigmatella aurantiaca DW4/3-1]|uniref:Uncharacterized protein n=1 Tax=Stigmatella aurantiaca (strain DW4/3-1) TaxID=378806 RepID=Q099H7_STIAD|nr:hypothetical protein STIAU_3886 [Stigmatella aurantiaca DW4/3-1]
MRGQVFILLSECLDDDVHGDELHIFRNQFREHGRNPDMKHRETNFRLREIQRLARDFDGNSQGVRDVDGHSARELPN